eukprot:3919463-Rhodomonas_salina.2
MERIVRYYKRRGFPQGFLKALRHFKCKICACCKRARVYKHTKRMKEKMVHNKRRKTMKGGDSPKAQTLEQQVLEAELHLDLEHSELHLDFAHSITLG